MPLLIDASVADKAKIDPRTGPIQGVQPNANYMQSVSGIDVGVHGVCVCGKYPSVRWQ